MVIFHSYVSLPEGKPNKKAIPNIMTMDILWLVEIVLKWWASWRVNPT